MIGSVRARLTIAVTLVVGALGVTAAIITPQLVRDGLVDDRLDAQGEVEQALYDGIWSDGGFAGLGTPELTALVGPSIAELATGLDATDALDEFREFDDDNDLHILVVPGVIATVTDDGLVRVESTEAIDGDQPLVSQERLEQLAFDYGLFTPFAFELPAALDEVPVIGDDEFAAVVDELIVGVTEFLDPTVFEKLPGFGDGEFTAEKLFDIVGEELIGSDDTSGLAELFDAKDVGGSPAGFAVGTRPVNGRPHIVTASLDGVDESVDRVGTLLWIGLPVAMAAAAMLTWLLAGRSLRPVAAITDRTRQIRSSTLHERVPVPASNDEVSALANEMNTMLDRVQREDERRRRFVSDASHELRSPIASIRTQAEASLADDHQHELAEGVLAEAERMSALVDDLLALARHDEQLRPPGQPVDLDDVVYAEASRQRRVPVDVTAVSAGRVIGRPDELGRVVGHLLDNAARHAAQQVTVSLTTDGAAVRLIVDDDGDGIPPAERGRVLERFVRLDGARTRDAGGAGLGLAVVDAVVGSAGGSIEVDESPDGGARFVISLPADGSVDG